MNTQPTKTTTAPATSARPAANLSSLVLRDLRRAMAASDDYVIEMDYADSKGVRTHRTISPIRFVGSDRMLALCLCREEPRQFYLSRCENIRLKRADEVLMPVMMEQ